MYECCRHEDMCKGPRRMRRDRENGWEEEEQRATPSASAARKSEYQFCMGWFFF